MKHDVKLYALSTCIHCKNTRQFLDDNDTDYDCCYVDKLEGEERVKVIEEIKKLNPNLSFPTLCIGDKVIVGYKKDEIKEALDA
ncbi:glutaredoxin family protein [Desulfoplanes formicivorans]|uniref:Glutaredoxin n=1 Tax=Desulfoplanes formicivorans TaxID=1592317 RepID=A0A194AFD1_9BACT|nr:glutaredoxin family protein [Desulfoplanes formicivorans]GAU07905.1 glutaredoxin [Desulfoplanes formicivorans]